MVFGFWLFRLGHRDGCSRRSFFDQLPAAIPADELLFVLIVRQRDAAAFAFRDKSAPRAEKKRCVAPPVEKNESRTIGFEAFAEALAEPPADQAAFGPFVDDFDSAPSPAGDTADESHRDG